VRSEELKGKRQKVKDKMGHLRLTIFILFTFYFSLFTASHAAPLTDESTLNFKAGETYQQKDEGAGLVAPFVKLFAGLAIVLGVMLIVYRIAKERLPRSDVLSGKGKLVNVVATQYLAPKKAVMVIEVAGERLVVGVGEEINLLARLEDAEFGAGRRESGVGTYGHTPLQKPDFKEHLETASSGAYSGVIDSVRERLERMKGKR
jgi:flagellar biogenesis protein FliO